MSEATVEEGGRAGFRPDMRVIVAALLLLLAMAVGIFLVLRFVDAERQRELREWQVRLGIVAESRFAAIESWLDEQFVELTGLAENASVQLYLTEITDAGVNGGTGGEGGAQAEAQAEYLRNLLVVIAERAGFATVEPSTQVKANVERLGVAGLALVDTNFRVMVATEGMPPLEDGLREFLQQLGPGKRGVRDIFLNAAGRPAMAFAVPIFALQSDPGTTAQIGYALGVKEIGDELYPLLKQPGETGRTAWAYLVRRSGETIEYVSPLPDQKPPLSFTMRADTPELDAAFSVANPSGFTVARNYRDEPVLVTNRHFTTVPWVLMYEVNRDEALAESEQRLTRLLAILLLTLAVIGVALVAVWHHASSRRARDAAERNRALAARFEDQSKLLRLVTDSQPTSIFILDAEGRYRFANRHAARDAGLDTTAIVGKSVGNVLGPEAAKRYLAINQQALQRGESVSEVERVETPTGAHVVQSEHIPVQASSDMPRAVLTVEHDITEAVTERERRSRTLGQLVRTLVSVVDRRDPFAAEHSTKVARLARAIAEEMGLPETLVDTAETAGNLLNLGKILLPPEVLTSVAPLSDIERQQLRDSLEASADLLEGIEFDGPVVQTLRQARAHWDGSGVPQGVGGEDILPTARIIAVANAFVGMTSRRAHREAMTVDEAINLLLGGVGKEFDRKVVAALINYLDNHGGRAQLAAA